ncbi:hypothetical protein SESBI_08177 [Sesbania bispinosa]|nr:hypothetical protein SESBI_08177 [Sesbania bispinosa]
MTSTNQDAFSSSVDATITPLVSSVSVSSASPIEYSSSIVATAITAFGSFSAVVGLSFSETFVASAKSSSLFLEHEIGENPTAKLEWKLSPDPFHFGCFESIQVQHQIPVAVSAPSNKVANQSMNADFRSVSEDSMDFSSIVENSYANRNGSKDC